MVPAAEKPKSTALRPLAPVASPHQQAGARRLCLAHLAHLACLAGVATAGLALAGCGHVGAPSRITLDEAELQRQLTAKFPLEQRLLELFEVRASSPQLRLLPTRNRLAAVLDLQARERILATRIQGRLNFESALRWDAGEQAVRLDQVRVLDFALDAPLGPIAPPPPGSVATATTTTAAAADTGRRTAGERVAAALAERVLEGLVLYRLPPEKQLQLAQAGVRPAALNITRSGLEITFEPQPK